MTPTRYLSGIALAAITLAGGLLTSQAAKAEDMVDFLWGGSEEFGGGRQMTSFSPQYKPNQIIVSFSDRRLYLITAPGKAITYPVAVPMGEARWQGVTVVSNKRINPSWTPTPEMVRNNPRLPRWVPGGHPMNPLGVRAMYLGSSAYRIHGTDAPWTIGQAVSHGCIRMTNKDVLDLYPRVPVGMRVTVTWQSFSGRTVASNDQGPSDGYATPASYGGDDASATDDDRNDQTASYSSRDGGTGLSVWDQDARRRQEDAPKKKYSRDTAQKKSKSTNAETETASKSSEYNDEPVTATKAAAVTGEKPTVAKAAATAGEKEVIKAASTSEKASISKGSAAEKATASKSDASAEKTPSKPATTVSEKPSTPKTSTANDAKPAVKASEKHEAKSVAKVYKPVADPVAIKKTAAPTANEKSSSAKPTDKKDDKTALAD